MTTAGGPTPGEAPGGPIRAGSMAAAFGVQREISTQESPKGVTIMAQEFAPGKPQPTLERVMRQETTDDTQDFLEVLEAIDRVQEKAFGDERGLQRGEAQSEKAPVAAARAKMDAAAAAAAPATGSGQARGKRAAANPPRRFPPKPRPWSRHCKKP